MKSVILNNTIVRYEYSLYSCFSNNIRSILSFYFPDFDTDLIWSKYVEDFIK